MYIFIRREDDFVNKKVHCVLCDKLCLPRLGNVMMPEIDFLQPPVTYSEVVILHSSLVRCLFLRKWDSKELALVIE